MENFNFNSEVFSEARYSIDRQIINVIEQLESGVFNKGKITLSLDIQLLPSKADTLLKQPMIEYKANHTLKHESKRKGLSVSNSVVKKDDESGNYIEIPIEDPQLSLLEDE